MKKIALLLFLLILCSCSPKALSDMTYTQRDDYTAIEWEGRVYAPYSAVDNSYMGKRIDIVNGDENDRVYEAKGLPVEQWIISCYKSGEMDSPMLMKEENANDIPEGFTSEYEWNN